MEQGRSSVSDLDFPLTRSELVRRIGSPLQRRRFRRARTAVALSTVVAVVATTLGGVFGWPYLVCGTGLHQVRGECVGVNDGSYSFGGDLDWITDRINRMNTQVQEEVDARDAPAFRIVLMSSLSRIENTDLDEAQIVRAVEGAYVALMRQNGFEEAGSGVEVRAEESRLFQLYLANEGSEQQGTEEVVSQLGSMVDDDIPLSVVIGQASTTTATEKAAEDLSAKDIPMVASSSTSTTINHVNSPGLIRSAPNNEDFAAALRDHLDGRTESQEGPVTGVLIADENEHDAFSQDLAAQFRRYLDPYLARNSLTFEGSAGSGNTPVYFNHIANEVCSDPQTNAVFFAGRHSDLDALLRSLEMRACGDTAEAPVTVYSMELGLLPGMIGSYSGAECVPVEDGSAPKHSRLVQASAFDPAWLGEGAWSPDGFHAYQAAITGTVAGGKHGTRDPEDLYNGYSLIYYDAATIAARATLLGFEANDGSTLAASVRNHLFRVTREPTGSGRLDYLEELEGRVSGRYIPILSSDCSVRTPAEETFQTPSVPYDELYPDLTD